jgi:hypothetical protein
LNPETKRCGRNRATDKNETSMIDLSLSIPLRYFGAFNECPNPVS